MMMISTAGGPPRVGLVDFHERPQKRFTRTTWVALGLVAAAHAGLGLALYHQRYELNAPVATPEPRPTIVELVPLKPPEPKPLDRPVPPAPNPPLNATPLPIAPTEALAATPVEGPPTDSTTLTVATPVETPIDNSPATAPTPPATPRVISDPSWLRQPSGDQLMRAYPQRALNAEVSGAATLNCLVTATGGVADCRVTRETPGGYGFGRAAQGLTRHFRLNPRTVDGTAEGSRVSIGLRFDLPPE